MHHAYIRERTHDPKAAILCYERAIRIDAANVDSLVRCGALMCSNDQVSEGVKNLSRALEWNRD